MQNSSNKDNPMVLKNGDFDLSNKKILKGDKFRVYEEIAKLLQSSKFAYYREY